MLPKYILIFCLHFVSAFESEPDCPPTKFWHIHGSRCVPYYCPRDTKRDKLTGLCNSNLVKRKPGRVRKQGAFSQAGDETEFGVTLDGYEIGSRGFFQPRGLALDPFHMAENGHRRGSYRESRRRAEYARHTLKRG